MMAHARAVFALVAVAMVAFSAAQDFPQKKEECKEDSECPPYHYCHYSYWIGQ
jgi:hypothetical protein